MKEKIKKENQKATRDKTIDIWDHFWSGPEKNLKKRTFEQEN